jgi:hypothetical protein
MRGCIPSNESGVPADTAAQLNGAIGSARAHVHHNTIIGPMAGTAPNSNPARRIGQIAPLEVRWREAMERIRNKLPADHPLQSGGNGMMSELGKY